MSSAFAAEKNPLGTRATMILTVFSCIGLGSFASSIVLTILLAAFKHAIEKDIDHLEWVWRLFMGIGKFLFFVGAPGLKKIIKNWQA